MVVSGIVNSMTKEITNSILSLGTAQSIWSDLKRIFHYDTSLKIFQTSARCAFTRISGR